MNSINCGIVSDGVAAFRHAHTINLHPGFSLISIAPYDKRKGEELRKSHAIAHVDSDSEYLYERDEIDAVVIASPTPLHFREALYALRYSKIIVIESPVSLSSVEIETLLGEVRDGAFIFNCNPYLYLPLEIPGGYHSYTLSFHSFKLEKEEMAEIALEVALSLFSIPLSYSFSDSTIKLKHGNAEGEIILLPDTDTLGLSLSVDGVSVIDRMQYYDALDNFYSYLYRTIEKGGDIEKMMEVSFLSAEIREKIFQ